MIEREEDFMPLPIPKQKQQPPKRESKKSRTKKRVANKEVNVEGMDASQEAINKRAHRFSSLYASNDNNSTTSRTSSSTYLALSENYDKYMGKGLIGGVDGNASNGSGELNETDYEHMTVKGTSTILEKEYLRLTAPPRPELVRPRVILQEHLNNLKQEYYGLDTFTSDKNKSLLAGRERTPQSEWVKDTDHKEQRKQQNRCHRPRRRDYLWFCSQLKAVRQDCTVQRIQGEFAVDVYETHARIALQEGDLNE
jgi:SAC3 family protein LENG8/THP3